VKSSTMSGREGASEIRLTQAVRAPVERLWRACADPRGLAGWQADDVFGEVVEGGILSLSWPALDVTFQLEVVEVIENKRIVFETAEARLALDVEDGRVALTH
jgi:uncharacterized protein YndB with AHSA1/START domain